MILVVGTNPIMEHKPRFILRCAMKGCLMIAWMGVTLVFCLALTGCSGIFMEQRYEDGRAQYFRVDGGEGWRNYDRKATKPDDTCIMLRKEMTF